MMSEREKIDLITRISLDINEVKDIDLLLERILTNVRNFYSADAGSIYLREGDKLKFSFSQNDFSLESINFICFICCFPPFLSTIKRASCHLTESPWIAGLSS